MHSAIAHPSLSNAQPVPQQWPPLPVYRLDTNSYSLGQPFDIILSICLGVRCPSSVPSQLVVSPIPLLSGQGEKLKSSWVCTSTTQQQLNTSPFLIPNPSPSTVPAAGEKITSPSWNQDSNITGTQIK